MQSGIYGIHNVINGKWYVGQSTNIPRRKISHFSYLRGGQHRNEHLQVSFNKHGESAFEFRILEKVSEDMMDVRERAWIEYYGSLNPLKGYNLDSGGNLNKHHSAETKLKMSRPCTVEKRLKISQTALAAKRHPTEETLKKLRIAQKRNYARRNPCYPAENRPYPKPRFH